MHIATVSSKSQITIPKRLFQSLNIKPRQKVIIDKAQDMLVIKPLRKSVVNELAGSLADYVTPEKRGTPFSVIRDETQKETAQQLATKK